MEHLGIFFQDDVVLVREELLENSNQIAIEMLGRIPDNNLSFISTYSAPRGGNCGFLFSINAFAPSSMSGDPIACISAPRLFTMLSLIW